MKSKDFAINYLETAPFMFAKRPNKHWKNLDNWLNGHVRIHISLQERDTGVDPKTNLIDWLIN